jgi:predicted Ser/Thr protein kinase
MSEQRAPTQAGLGRYRLLGRLGEGGMGVVHLAEAPGGGLVALKVLRPHVVGDDESRARLAREVTSLRRVRSPLVAEVFDADPWGETPYVVTRYVRGPSLHERVSTGGPLVGPELAAVGRGLAEALAAVHRAGVLHRDVKPSNVLLESGAPVLIDFGLARLLDDPRLTASGWLLGTPGYLAPEILHGQDATPAADIHAWAATLVYAATGRPPYGSGPAVAVMDRVRRGEHDVSGLPAELHDLLSECLATDPQRRPSAEQVLRWLSAETATRSADGAGGPRSDSSGETRPITVVAPVTAHVGATRHEPSPIRGWDDDVEDEAGEEEPAQRPVSAPTLTARLTRAATALAMAVCFLAVSVVAPYVAASLLLGALWLAATSARMFAAAEARRQRRGQRRSDPFVSSVTSPWHLLVALPSALALGVCALGAGGLTALVLATVGDVHWRWPALSAGAGVAVAVACWGPLSPRPRFAGHRLLVRVAAPVPAAAILAALLLGLAAALFAVSQIFGTWWWPLGVPPSSLDVTWLDPRR